MVYGKLAAVAVAAVLCCGAAGAGTSDPSVLGEYVEARTCNVWTGSCFANGEMNLIGKSAVMAWSVTRGSWEGVALDGLRVAAAVNAEGTLHTQYEGKISSALYVDRKATEAQEKALIAMAKALAPDHLVNVVKVERQDIAFKRKGIEAALAVGKVIEVKTGEICDCVSAGCTAYQVYPAVSRSTEIECAKSLANSYQDGVLGVRWSESGLQGAMVGTFAK